MAFEEHVGAVVMELDGREIDCTSISVRESTGRRPVRVMSRANRIAGFVNGVPDYALSVSAVIPKGGTPVNWSDIQGARITIEPITGGGARTSYVNCCATSVGEAYQIDGEARIDIEMFASHKVTE